MKDKTSHKLSGNMKKKRIGLTAGYTIITICIIFAFARCEVFKNDSGEIPTSDIGITTVDAPSSVVQGERADISVTVKNFGNQQVSDTISVTLTDDTDENTLTSENVSMLAPDSSRSFTYNWNTEEASVGEHTLTAVHDYEDNEHANDTTTVSITIEEPADNDIAVSEIDTPSSAIQGDDVSVEVTLQNTGGITVSEEVNISLENLTNGTEVGTQTINEIEPGGTTTLTYSWNTDGASTGDHELQATHDYHDDNSENNTATATITLTEPQENDIAISDINAPSSATHGDEIDVEVTVENTGNQPASDINVTLENLTGGTTIESQSVSELQEGASTTLIFSWNTSEASTGEHELQAIHDVADDNEENNSDVTAIVISEQQENDIAITNVNSVSSVEQGEETDIEVTVENTGNQPLDESIDVTLEDLTDGTTIGSQSIGNLEAQDNTTLTFSWDTGDASTGEHEIEASHSFDDDNTANNTGSTTVTVDEPTVIDISINDLDAVSSATQGENVTITVTVQNEGNSDLPQNIDVTVTNETTGENIGEQTITTLSAGNSEDRTFIWETDNAQTGTHTIVASHNLDDDNSSNDSESTTVTVEEPADLSITNVSATPSSVTEGGMVEVTVTIQNTGDQPAENFSVTLEDLTDGNTIDTQTGISLEPGDNTTLTFNWDTQGASDGEHNLRASNSFNDDAGSETVTVNEAVADIAITNVSTNPSSVIQGETVNIEVDIENTGNQTAENFSVSLEDLDGGSSFNPQTGITLEPGESTTVSFEWNTDGADPGEHELQASNSVSDDVNSATVTVDEAVTDIEITEIDAPDSIEQGETVNITVHLQNQSNHTVEEDFDVSLTDQDGELNSTVTLSEPLAAGQSANTSHEWDTGGESTGDHTLVASHNLSSDQEPGNDQVSSTVNIAEQLVINSIEPNSADEDSAVDVVLNGSGFETGMDITFEDGNGPEPSVTNISVQDSQTAFATVSTPDNGSGDDIVWDVRVTNPDNSTAVLEDGFTVTADDDD